ncbi:urokinase plasminogen activator surface receptor-like [Alosa alosa]|uniref:urokinase plasminogen activator surface receptor-like n=1 Tax=Alosa alosa TaxID=278164 RepID=UPI0020151F06|nr:urokinase plasminogen activator surface receptor-like [Alosa alosa]
MSLLINIVLTFALLYQVSAQLQCQVCLLDCTTPLTQPCSTGEICFTSTSQVTTDSNAPSTIPIRGCIPQTVCNDLDALTSTQTFSFGLGLTRVTTAASCCNTAGCNSNQPPAPMNTTKTDLSCFTCNSTTDQVCLSNVTCVGIEDRCFNGSVTFPNGFPLTNSNLIRGCASRNVCPALQGLGSFGNFSCCEECLCNEASDLKLNLSFLILSLVGIFMH